MAKHDKKTLQARSKLAWGIKDNWQGLLSECYDYALPDRNPYRQTGNGRPVKNMTQGTDKSSPRVFDSTLQHNATKLANKLQYELFPMGTHWADLVPGAFVLDEKLKQQQKSELQKLQKVLFASIQLSNFDLAIAEWLIELVVVGTAVMVVQRGNDVNPVIYRCVSQAHVAFLEGGHNHIDYISIKHNLRIDQIKPYWSDAKIPELTDRERQEMPSYDLDEVTYYDYDAGIWRYVVMMKGKRGTSTTDGEIIVEREYRISPINISRWSKAVDETQGRSLVMAALPDARVLSAVKMYILKQAALAIAGAYLVRNDGVVNVNNVKVFPGATIAVRSTGGTNGASVVPLEVGGQTQLAQLIIADLKEGIDKIMLNTGLPDLTDGVRSATEFVERMKDLQQSIGAPFSRILREGIVPMLESHLQVMAEIGIVQEPEGGVFRLNAGDVELRFTSPLVQGQSVREIEQLLNATQVIASVAGQQAAELLPVAIKVEDLPAWAFDKTGADVNLLRSEEEINKIQKGMAEMAAQQQGAPVGGMQQQEASDAAALEANVTGNM